MHKSDAANMLINYSNKMINAVYRVCLGILYLLMATNCQENSLTTKMNLTTTMYVIIKSVNALYKLFANALLCCVCLACVRACVRACVHACACVCVCPR